MTAKMHSFFEKRKWNDKRDTPQASLASCRLHFLMFSALHAEKAALLRRKNAFGRTTALLAPRMPSQNKKAIPYGMTFCFGGDKRDRTADLMTASHALSQLSYTPIGGIILSDLFGNCKCFFRKSKKICANVWESCTVSRFEQLENVGLGGKQSVKIRFGVFRADEQMRCFGSGGIRCGNRGIRRVEGAVAVGSLCIGG